jgi:hypothetical protein
MLGYRRLLQPIVSWRFSSAVKIGRLGARPRLSVMLQVASSKHYQITVLLLDMDEPQLWSLVMSVSGACS